MKMKLKLSDKWYQIRTKAEAGCLDIAAGMSLEPVSKSKKFVRQKKLYPRVRRLAKLRQSAEHALAKKTYNFRYVAPT